jgi:lipopolysaccharide export system permease protein
MMLGYLNSMYLMPSTFREFKDLQREFRSELSSLFLQEGVFKSVVAGVTVFVRERSEDGALYGIIIHDERQPGKPITMMAEKGAIVSSEQGPRVLMVNGNRQEVGEGDGRLSLLYFDRYTFDLSAFNKSDLDLWREPRERYLDELFFPSTQEGKIFNFRELRMEGIFRLSSPLLYLAYTAIALALLLGGEFNRRGQSLRILISIVTVTAVQVAVIAAKSLGEKFHVMEAVLYVLPLFVTVLFLSITASGRSLARRKHTASAGEFS